MINDKEVGHTFKSEVAGIECIVGIVSCTPYRPAQTRGPVEACYDAEGGDFEFRLFSLCGTRLDVLEDHLTAKDRFRIEREYKDWIERN